MGDQGLRKPRRKPKARLHLLESPLPVPIQTITGKTSTNTRWYYYFGHVKTDHVAIFRMGDLTFLYRLGFFGKGMLSKSRPQFEKYNDVLSDHARKQHLYKYTALEPEEREIKLLTFAKLQKERLRQHSSWSVKNNKITTESIGQQQQKAAESSGPTFEKPICEDLHTAFDDGLHEELTTDGEDDDDDDDDDDADTIKQCINEKETMQPRDGQEVSIGEKRSATPPNKDMLSEEKLMKLEDSYKLFEYLQLTFEEAFFLSFGLGCLSVQDDQEHSMTLNEMWKGFSGRKATFIQQYIAYHHFRSKGWVARFGNLYGADFLLYQDGMPFYHASYSVFVFLVKEESLEISKQPPLDWKRLSCICRVNEKVAKEVMFCYVIQPKDLNDEDLMSVSCIKKFKVMEVVMRRWVPEKHREINL